MDKIPGADIDGAMFDTALVWLHEQAKKMNSILEIGARYGRSTTALLAGCPGKVTVVDSWQEPDHPNAEAQFMKNIRPYKEKLTVFKGTSVEAAEWLEGPFDMTFIDGSHLYPDVKLDINNFYDRTNILICGHDYTQFHHGVIEAVDEFFGKEAISIAPNSIWYLFKDKTIIGAKA